ncbi:MAG: maltose transport protein AmyC [Subtercola sp.]|nr:maltose transport protein AmyC [Subtercola sp.]
MFSYTRRSLTREMLLIVLAAIWWIPFYILAVNSFAPSTTIGGTGLGLPAQPTFDSYVQAWQGNGNGTLGAALINSIVISAGSVICLIVFGSVAAYVLARRGGRFAGVLYALFVLGIILPYQLGVVPLYSVFRTFGLVGNYAGMILLYTGLLMPFSVFLYTGFIRALPRDYEEAASVDGATPVRTFIRIVFPLLRPITATVGILTGLIVWNDFFTQLVFLGGSGNETLPVAVYSAVGAYATQWGVVFAAVVIAVIPILLVFFFAQRNLIQGFTGGTKG